MPRVFADRFRVQRRQPGFVLAEARHGGYLVGYASGMPLRPSTSWWRNLTTPLPADVTAEHPGRTFALVELLVRASWRRQGIGQTLHDLILANRPEERATLTVLPAATPAQNAFAELGLAQDRAHARSPSRLTRIRRAGHRAPALIGADDVRERLAGREPGQLRGDQPVRARARRPNSRRRRAARSGLPVPPQRMVGGSGSGSVTSSAAVSARSTARRAGRRCRPACRGPR